MSSYDNSDETDIGWKCVQIALKSVGIDNSNNTTSREYKSMMYGDDYGSSQVEHYYQKPTYTFNPSTKSYSNSSYSGIGNYYG
jgi:hypothetical protein